MLALLGYHHYMGHQPVNSCGHPIPSRTHAYIPLCVRDARGVMRIYSCSWITSSQTLLHEMAHLKYRWHFDGFYKLNERLHQELLRKVSKGILRGMVE